MRFFSVIIFSILFTLSYGFPSKKGIEFTKVKPGLKHKLDDTNLLELQSPIDNLVEPDIIDGVPETSADLVAPTVQTKDNSDADEKSQSEDSFTERKGFATGHRIPPEILERIAQQSKSYVDSSNFRAPKPEALIGKPSKEILPPTSDAKYPKPTENLTPPFSVSLEDNKDIKKPSTEIKPPQFNLDEPFFTEFDPAFHSTLDSFVPQDYLE